MAKFQKGDVVVIKKSKQKGVVTDTSSFRATMMLYNVFVDNTGKLYPEDELEKDITFNDLFDLLKHGYFADFRNFSRMNTSFKIKNTSNNTISSLKASKTIFKPYQYKPLLKFLNSDNRRILIADEVGLGKTIEAGHIMLELLGRKELDRVLVVCTKSIKIKWSNELKNRFNLNFKIYQRVTDLIDDLKLNRRLIRGIINYDLLRESRRKKSTKVKGKEITEKKVKNELLTYIEEEGINFDLIICDESHRLRNKTSYYRGMTPLLHDSRAVIFMTATPVMIGIENLFNQLCVLNPHLYNIEEFQLFTSDIELNKPFIKALQQLNNNYPLSKVGEELVSAVVNTTYTYGENQYYTESKTVGEIFKDDTLFSQTMKKLNSSNDSIETRVNLQSDLTSFNTLNSIFTRTKKRDVTTDWTSAEREATLIPTMLTLEEKGIINELDELYGEIDELAFTTRKRQYASSLWAFKLKTQNQVDYSSINDSKYSDLRKVINPIVRRQAKVIVFAFFTDTLTYLFHRLQSEGYKCALIHGKIDERENVIEKFRTNKEINILLSSEVGSEGIDLQFSDTIVNYDLPWNPMVVEQRIGRIDRFGQKAKKVNIITLVTKGTIEEQIYNRLLVRINIFKESIGDLEAILQENYDENYGEFSIDSWRKLEMTLYNPSLTESEKSKKLEDFEKALIRNKTHLKEVQEGLAETITNDVYFQNEIRRIEENYRYVTEKELINYVQSLILNYLTDCSLQKIDDVLYKFTMPLAKPGTLVNFLKYYCPQDPETELMCNMFINSIRGKNEIIITFNQEYAQENYFEPYINSYHPLTLSILNYFDHTEETKENSFSLLLPLKRLQERNISMKRGSYILGVYSVSITKSARNQDNTKEQLVPILYNLSLKELVDDLELTEIVLGESQQYAEFCDEIIDLNNEEVDDLKGLMTIKINDIETKLKEDTQVKSQSENLRKMNIEGKYFDYQIFNMKQTIEELEERKKLIQFETNEEIRKEIQRSTNILPARYQMLQALEDEKERRISELQELTVTTRRRLLSLNHLIIK